MFWEALKLFVEQTARIGAIDIKTCIWSDTWRSYSPGWRETPVWWPTPATPSCRLWSGEDCGDVSRVDPVCRCHFSPAHTTGQSLIYTGCAAGRVVIYDLLTGEIVKVSPPALVICIPLNMTSLQILPGHKGCVRDVSWHPHCQEIDLHHCDVYQWESLSCSVWPIRRLVVNCTFLQSLNQEIISSSWDFSVKRWSGKNCIWQNRPQIETFIKTY